MKILSILAVALLVAAPLFAAELSDAEMSGIYAGAVDVGINDVSATDSAVAAQSNIGAIVGSAARDVTINNTNRALVANIVGNAAAALQSNIGVIATFGNCGDQSCPVGVVNAKINNTNKALVINVSDDSTGFGVDGASVDVVVGLNGGSINDTLAARSAVASQSNIGVIAGLAAIDGARINNTNRAIVGNIPAPVVASIIAAHH